MKHSLLSVISIFILLQSGLAQKAEEAKILFRGLVIDASTFSPISNTQIMINREFSSISGEDGTFSFYVKRQDTIVFKSLGYKKSTLFVSDTLKGQEFITGIYMNSDTVSIGEVIIVPKFTNLKSEILNARSKTPANMENAKYNVAISAYQGRQSQNVLSNPADNYSVIAQRMKVDAYERGGIPSDRIVGISPLLLIPAAYLFIHGLPEKPPAMRPQMSDQEVEEVHRKYLETHRQKK